MSSSFTKFEHFGVITDEAKRKQLAEKVFNNLYLNEGKGIGMTYVDTDNFVTAIDKIIDNEELRAFCLQNKELATQVTSEILEFCNQTKKQINRKGFIFENEKLLLNEFRATSPTDFQEKWSKIKHTIRSNYNKKLNYYFYDDQFKKSLDTTDKINRNKHHFESVREHFVKKWEELLFQRQTNWELELIDVERKKICELLYKHIEELKKILQALTPIFGELGRLWDMSKGNWQRINFDILKRYADLLEKDEALKALVDMLGRMQQAEKEYEEELFKEIVVKTEWQAHSAAKSDIVGVHDSDDLSSMLPSETALLADSTLQMLFLKKYAEKKLQTFEHQSRSLFYREEEIQNSRLKEKEEKKGPFILCVDTSGSMHGTPETVAKSLCLAMLKIAVRENRKCYLISFSTTIQTLELSDLRNSLDKVIDFLSMSFNGGTDAEPAFNEALKMLKTENFKKADVIMISDFIMSDLAPSLLKQITAAKENKTNFHSLVIGNSNNPATIQHFDNNWIYNPNQPDSLLNLVKNIRKF